MKTGMSKVLQYAAVIMLVAACGKGVQKTDRTQQQQKEGDEGESKKSQKTVQVDISVSQAQEGVAFALATDATAYEMELAGCASGFNNEGALFTSASSTVQLYQNDLNCLMRLKSFTINGIRYVDPNWPGGSFATYADGETATFQDENDALNLIAVSVVTQLGSPLSSLGEEVNYAFTKVQAGGPKTVEQVSDPHTVTVSGVPAPNFFIKTVALTDGDVNAISATGAGIFDFELECNDPITDTVPAASCSGQAMASAGAYELKYVLVPRAPLGATPGAAMLETQFAGAEAPVTIQRASGAGDNGGFTIDNIQGSDQIHLNPAMALILRVVDNGAKSYTYYDVTVTTVAQQP